MKMPRVNLPHLKEPEINKVYGDGLCRVIDLESKLFPI